MAWNWVDAMENEKPQSRAEAIALATATGQPYELALQEVNGQPCRVFVNAPRSLRELFELARSDEMFYVYESERYSFEDMYERAASVAHVLVETYNIRPGDRVAISMRNYPEWVIAFMAVTSIGGIAVAMNALWEAEEMAYGLTHCGARVIFADQERMDRVARCDIDIAVIGVRPAKPLAEGIRLMTDLYANKVDMPQVDVDSDADATILYTSGSTGHPKGAVSTHRNVLSALLSWELDGAAGALVSGITPEPLPYQVATLLGVPLFHVAGLHAVLLSSFRAQRKVVAMYKWDVETAAELIEREKIATFVAPAAMTGDLVAHAGKTQRDLSSLVMVGGGGAPRAPEQVKRIASSFKKAMPNTGWGMTETNAIGTGVAGEAYLAKPGSSGVASAVLDLAIVDATGRHLPAGERGELLIRGTSVIRGYWENPEANAASFTDGWFHTGDVAYLDDEGFLYIVDRIKQLIIRGGENIGCGEVEAALLTHPQVLEASVYGLPDERLGEEIGATVYVSAPVDEDALRAYLLDHLAKFKIPRYLRFESEALPRIASGKIDKLTVRQWHLEQLG
ncbi:MAG: class I adenylate-forming enzyme family protein [Pseudomonadota bacterium]